MIHAVSLFGFVICNFLLAFLMLVCSIAAAGCADVKAPKYGYVRRESDTAIVSCNYTEETWYLTCEGDRWIGSVGNCSSSGNLTSAFPLLSGDHQISCHDKIYLISCI